MSIKLNYKYITLFILIIISVLSYNIGYKKGMNFGYINGYSRGEVVLAVDIIKELNITVNSNTKEKCKLFRNIKDITLCIYEKNGIKTIAYWK